MPNPIFANSVVRVGNGRGFITKSPYRERVVITAAHCLPEFMAAHPARHEHERTYRKLLGPLGAKPTIAVACAFVDPVADIAILKAVDYELWPQEQEAFAALTDVVRPLKIGKLPFTIGAKTKVWCLSLAGEWIEYRVSQGRPLAPLFVLRSTIEDGMSGSPIVLDDGSAVGVICTGGNLDFHGPNPYLRGSLPGWMLQQPSRLQTRRSPPPASDLLRD